MGENRFAEYEKKLEQNVYGGLKGQIRMLLLEKDITEMYSPFTSGSLDILDVGGGAGHFAGCCCRNGHRVLLVDSNTKMIEAARQNVRCEPPGEFEVQEQDFLSESELSVQSFDIVLVHGSAEWMSDPESAIRKACSLVRPGGILSLLIFNSDRNMLKQGINGKLLAGDLRSKKKKLTPPGAMSPREVHGVLSRCCGKVLLTSGIRIFYGFFRQNDTSVLSPEEWIEQEMMYYRKEPFNLLGEHTHFIWEAC